MPQVSLIAQMDEDPDKACADLSLVASHLIGYGMTLQSINVSGQGAVSITYTGGTLNATQKAHLGLS